MNLYIASVINCYIDRLLCIYGYLLLIIGSLFCSLLIIYLFFLSPAEGMGALWTIMPISTTTDGPLVLLFTRLVYFQFSPLGGTFVTYKLYYQEGKTSCLDTMNSIFCIVHRILQAKRWDVVLVTY